MNTTNRNMLWASIFVDELIRAGVTSVCVCPGSRSTPLAFAFAERTEIKKYSLLDERGAGFFCLGLGLAAHIPTALLCTSGTAAANFLPAIVEASQSEVPMLVLTADRPAELRHSGANQTIDQLKLYGKYVRWFVEMPTPEADPLPQLLASLRTTADRAVAVAVGLDGQPGPVHLNFPFRKPLEPTPRPADLSPAWQKAMETDPGLHGRPRGAPFVHIRQSRPRMENGQLEALAGQIQASPRGLIICGPRCPGEPFGEMLGKLARSSGYPILADPLSGVRFGTHAEDVPVLGGYETFLAARPCRDSLPSPEVVLRFGDLPTSAALGAYLAGLHPTVGQIAIGSSPRWTDDTFVLSEVVRADATEACVGLNQKITRPKDDEFVDAWLRAESTTWRSVDEFRQAEAIEGAILAEVVEQLPAGTQLYVANSLPIRHLDQFARPRAIPIGVFANRGASGIDGTISSALGVAAAGAGPLVLVSGDLSFYHDLNGLIALARCGVRATIVLIHNDGGGIFERLPAAQFEPGFSELIHTPHGLDFAPVAQMFGLEYHLLAGPQDLSPALLVAMGSARSHLLVLKTDSLLGEESRNKIIRRVSEKY